VFKTLRGQLVLSHILPSLVIIPLMGIALVYFLESRLILPGLENQLADDAVIFAGIARTQPQIFSDAQLAGSLIEDYELKTSTRVMLLDPQGILLASSDPTDDYRLNQVLDTEGAAKARLGITSRYLDFSLGLRGEVVDVFTPVEDDEGHLTGIVRLSYRFSTVEEQLMSLRYLIVGIIIVGAVSSAILGFLLALNIGHPIQQATESVLYIVRGGRTDPFPQPAHGHSGAEKRSQG
jgi:sensor histidine kinase regulating citrate/malate metabolism